MPDSSPYILDRITIRNDPRPHRIELGFNFTQSKGEGERPACFWHGLEISQPIDRHAFGDLLIALAEHFKSENCFAPLPPEQDSVTTFP